MTEPQHRALIECSTHQGEGRISNETRHGHVYWQAADRLERDGLAVRVNELGTPSAWGVHLVMTDAGWDALIDIERRAAA